MVPERFEPSTGLGRAGNVLPYVVVAPECTATKEKENDRDKIRSSARRGQRAHQDVDTRCSRRREGAPATGPRGIHALHLQACRGDARRSCRHRRDGRIGDRHQGRDHSGGGGRGHWLRHDGGAHLADRVDLPDNWKHPFRDRAAVPHGRNVGRSKRDTGAWGDPPAEIVSAWATLAGRFKRYHRQAPRAGEDQQPRASGHAGHRKSLHRDRASTTRRGSG